MKMLVTSIFSSSNNLFKTPFSQELEKTGLSGKALNDTRYCEKRRKFWLPGHLYRAV